MLKLRLAHKGIALILTVLVFELAFLGVLICLLQQAEYDVWRESHAKSVQSRVNSLGRDFCAAGIALFAYFSLGKNATNLAGFDKARERVSQDIRTLSALVGSEPSRQESLKRVRALADKGLGFLDRQREAMEAPEGTAWSGLDQRAQLHAILTEILPELDKFSTSERELEAVFPAIQARSREKVVAWIIVGLTINVAASVALCLLLFRGITSRLDVLLDNTKRLAAGKQLNPVLPGHDEIAHLDQVFHSMATALEEANRKERELTRLKNEFVAMVSHDMRIPLTSVTAALSLLKEGAYGEMPQAADKTVQQCERTTSRLISMVNDILDAEKLESGSFQVSLDEYPLLPIVTRAREAIQNFAETNEVKVLVNVAPEIFVYADEDRLEQVLMNLLSNAIKFSPQGSTVNLSAHEVGAQTEINVVDEGCGIDQQSQQAVFDRFKQVEPDVRKHKGSGLGLHIAKQIVELCGGIIGVDSQPGRGSRFWIRLQSGAPHENAISQVCHENIT